MVPTSCLNVGISEALQMRRPLCQGYGNPCITQLSKDALMHEHQLDPLTTWLAVIAQVVLPAFLAR